MDLLEKLGNVEIKITDRFPPEDTEYCRQAEKDYLDAYNLYSEFSYTAEDINESIAALSDDGYMYFIDKCDDAIYDCNENFINKICGYFRKKYAVTIENPSWKTEDTDKYGQKRMSERRDAVPLQYILDNIYEQMGGMSFEEKAFNELKEDAREALTTHNGKSKYCVKGTKLIIDGFYNSQIDANCRRYRATIEKKHRSFFKALTHFEYEYYDISQKYEFLCGYQIDEKNGVYDKHVISSAVIYSIRVYKNGKIEVEFKNYKKVMQFLNTYFPGIPQTAA
jgi:hypothetical protein